MKTIRGHQSSVTSHQSKEIIRIFLFFLFCILFSMNVFASAEEEKEPIVVDGDQLEYSQIRQEVTATGQVVVTYKDSKLICDKATVNMLTKDCMAEGRVKLIDKRGEVLADSMLYNFNTKTGELLDARVVSEPIYGKGAKIQRVSENEYSVENGSATTCSYDNPHYRIDTRKIRFFPGDKVTAKDIILFIGKVPLLYLPGLSKSLKDTIMPLQIQPGKNKDWGYYMLSAWRFNFSEKLKGRLLFDARQKLGTSQGFGLNYNNTSVGRGDFKFYYTNEKPEDPLPDGSDEFERYLVRWRHIWQMTDNDRIITEFYKIKDSRRNHDPAANFLKDYFYREFEKDEQPKTYFLYNHIFPDASFNFYVQKRTTTFFNQIEKLPEASFSMPAYQIFDSPVFFQTNTVFSNLKNRGVATIPNDDLVHRLDTYNQLFFPFKLSFLNLSPFAGFRQTFYSRDLASDSSDDRTAFYSGMDLSTKFFRTFADNFRHILNPAVRYEYISKPSVGRWRLIPFDDVDMLEGQSKFTLELTNILQRKKNDKVSNAALFRVYTDYNLKRQQMTGKGFEDINYDLEINPNERLRFETDARFGAKEGYFKEVNVDLSTKLGNDVFKDRSFVIGHRYERSGGKALTSQLIWRINPKWKFRIYERYQFAHTRGRGLEEQEYSISRDLHCWEFDITFNRSKDHGSTVWFIFRLKAFPEYEFDVNQSYNAPKTADAN